MKFIIAQYRMRYLGWIKGNSKKKNTKISNIGGNKKKTVVLLKKNEIPVQKKG